MPFKLLPQCSSVLELPITYCLWTGVLDNLFWNRCI